MNVEEMMSGARDAMSVKRVFGEPYERDGVTVIPVAFVRGGGGGGGGEEADGKTGGGGGFGVMARPVGVYVIRDGNVSWEPTLDLNRVIAGGQVLGLLALLILRSLVKRRRRSSG